MRTLCIDTSTKYLGLVLLESGKMLASYVEEVPKKQSEYIFVEIDRLFQSVGWKPNDLEAICVSEGPGSYTGVRIGMTVAKVICSQRNLPLFTLSTFLLYAGKKEGTVLLDARSKKAFVAEVSQGNVISTPNVVALADLPQTTAYLGDAYLVGQENPPIDIANAFVELQAQWKRVDNIHALVPLYIKESI
ncbi:MAG: tRNA (adenosine(37)-N6)-threonylcarbamoyltransferase complex dimerization subunit type 1 TsaB [Erysipelotrichaceae bacterium]